MAYYMIHLLHLKTETFERRIIWSVSARGVDTLMADPNNSCTTSKQTLRRILRQPGMGGDGLGWEERDATAK